MRILLIHSDYLNYNVKNKTPVAEEIEEAKEELKRLRAKAETLQEEKDNLYLKYGVNDAELKPLFLGHFKFQILETN